MATRFRRHSTRKTRKSKALKTRKHRGGNFMSTLLGKKSPLSSVAGPSAKNTRKQEEKTFAFGYNIASGKVTKK